MTKLIRAFKTWAREGQSRHTQRALEREYQKLDSKLNHLLQLHAGKKP